MKMVQNKKLKPFHLVLLDDNLIIRNLIRTFLGRFRHKLQLDLKIYTSEDGVQGLGYVFITEPDIIIIDTTLPKYSGRELLEYLTTNPKFKSDKMRVIVLHAGDFAHRLPKSYLVLNKNEPFFLTRLLHQIQIIIGKHNPSVQHLQYKDWLTAFGHPALFWANRSDVLSHNSQNSSLIFKPFLIFIWILSQIPVSINVAIIHLLSKPIKDDNLNQSVSDLTRFRISYYPAIAALLSIGLLIVLQMCAYLGGGVIFFQGTDKVVDTEAGSGDDFKVQRGVTTIASGNTTATITAGTHYTAPAAASKAFIRITNTGYVGAGNSTGGGTQTSDDVTAFINNPGNITTSVTFERQGNFGDTRIAWEIVEYSGPSGGANEIVVRSQSYTDFTTTGTTADSSTISGVNDANDIVIFVTGVINPDTGSSDYNTGLVTAEYISSSNVARFTRGEAGGDDIGVSWAAVEFTGSNWKIQRIEHNYSAAGVTETETITAINDLSRAFIHAQKRNGNGINGLDEFGHQVWLSATNTVSFRLQTGASSPSNQYSIAWIIENTQITGKVMNIIRGSSSKPASGTEPGTHNVSYGPISDLTIASLFANNSSSGTNTTFPRGIFAATLSSVSNIEFWFSDNGQTQDIRYEVVEWPTAPATTDATVSSLGAQVSSVYQPTTNTYLGGAFVIIANTGSGSRTLSSVTISEQGSIDAQNHLDNIKMFYELDSSSPADCNSENFDESESQYGATDTDGFSAANGISTFTQNVSFSDTSAVCLYVVFDVTTGANIGDTIEVEITAPDTDVTIATGTVGPASTIAMSGSTTVLASATVGALGAQSSFALIGTTNHYVGGSFYLASNNGTHDVTSITINETGTVDAAVNLNNIKLYYELDSSAPVDCASESFAGSETQYGSTDTDGFSSADGSATFVGSMTIADNYGTCFYVVLDISSSASPNDSLEIEISSPASDIVLSTGSKVGPTNSVSLSGTTIINYETVVTAGGSQTSTITIPNTNQYLGGYFVISSNNSSKNVTSITIREQGTVDGANGLANIKLYYEGDTTAPYDCASETYSGSESQYGSTDANGFSSANGTSTFIDNVGISTTSSMCIYLVLDVTTGAVNGQTLEIDIANPITDVVVSTGSASPNNAVAIAGTTSLVVASAFSEGMFVYSHGSSDTAIYKTIDTNGTWSTGQNTADVDTGTTNRRVISVRLYASSTRDEYIMLSTNSNGTTQYLYGQVYNGTWGNVQLLESFSTATLASSEARYYYDGAYLANGNFMAISSDLSNTPQFSIWDGSSWSTVSAPTQDVGGIVNTLVARNRPGTNEVMVVTQDNSDDINTIYYDGSGTNTTDWSTPTEHGAEYDSANDDNIAFTWSKNNPLRGILVFEDSFSDTTPNVNIFTANGSGGGSWGTANEAVDTGDEPTEAVVVDRPGTNEFIFCVKDATTTSPDINCLEENDNDDTPTIKTTTGGEIADSTDTNSGPQKVMGLEYEQISANLAVVIYSDGTSVPKLKTYDPNTGTNGTWDSSATSLSDVTETVRWVDLTADPASNNIAAVMKTSGADLHTVFWDGENNEVYSSGDRAMTEHSDNSGLYTTSRSGSFAWKLYNPNSNNVPSVSSVLLNNGDNINLTENTTTPINWTATITDIDGYADISSVVGKVYRSSVANAEECTPNDNNCYSAASCSLSGCSGSSCTATCSINMQFHADPTDSGTYAAQYWLAWVKATDSSSAENSAFSANDITDVNSLIALNVSSPLAYGTLLPGENTGSSNATTTITNTGNITIDGEVSGTDLCSDYPTCSGVTIQVSNQKYSLNGFTYTSGGISLSTTPSGLQINLAKPSSAPSNSTASLYWGIALPSQIGAGNYTGANSIIATLDN